MQEIHGTERPGDQGEDPTSAKGDLGGGTRVSEDIGEADLT